MGHPRLIGISLVASLLVLSGCSVKKMAMNQLGNALSGGGTVFSSDDDPELIKDALPFSLKLMESVLAETPEHQELLLALASGFTQYAYGFVQLESEVIEEDHYDRSVELRNRAAKLYLRAHRYGMRALELAQPGITETLRTDTEMVLSRLRKEDVPYIYWTALSWAGAISLSLDDPKLLGALPVVEDLMERALELDPDWEFGSIHSFFITYEMSRLNSDGDPVKKSTEHFQKAKALSNGMMASVYLAYAEAVALEEQNKDLFVSLLNQALSIDLDARPEWRLSNLIYQKRAKWLLTRLDWYFF